MTETVRSYIELKVWQKGIELVKMVYRLTQSCPKSETYGLASQMQRVALSIPSNIAEGQGRQYTGEFRQFLHIALDLPLNLIHSLSLPLNLVMLPLKTRNRFSISSLKFEK